MPTIQKLVLHNFKRFQALELDFDGQRNVLIGDNESGKSSILLALDLALSASRSRVETVGLETLFHSKAVDTFLSGAKTYDLLPKLYVEIYLSPGTNPDLNGKVNSKDFECDGLRMEFKPSDEFSQEILEVLDDEHPNFPFEYYELSFLTFSGDGYSGFKKHIRHLLIDSSRIDTDYAAREYTRAMYQFSTEPKSRNKLENLYRRSKGVFGTTNLADLNKTTQGSQFALRTTTRANLESDLAITEDGIAIDAKGKGRQCFIKTEFALNKTVAKNGIDALLLEEPENHLSHSNMRKLVDRICGSKLSQLIIATHSSLMSSRLDLRNAILLGAGLSTAQAALKNLSDETARFFMKAPDNNILEFVLSRKVILVEGVIGGSKARHSGDSTRI